MIELSIAVIFGGLLIVALVRLLGSAQEGLISAENRADLVLMNQRMGVNLRQSFLASQNLFLDSGSATIFAAYYTRIQNGRAASTAPAPVSDTVLPRLTSTAYPDPSYGAVFGNAVGFAALVASLQFSVQTSAVPLINEDVNLDRYQFVYIYPAAMGRQITGLNQPAIQLIEWRSIPYVSYTQLASLSGAKLTQTANILNQRGYIYAWDSSQSNAAAAFYEIKSSANPILQSTAASGGQPLSFTAHSWARVQDFQGVLEMNPDPLKPRGRIMRSQGFGGVSGWSSTYSLAYNSVTGTPANVRVNALYGIQGGLLKVPAMAALDAAKPTFPNGIELFVGGQSGAREIFARVVLMAASGGQRRYGPKEYIATEALVKASVRNPL